MIEILNNIPGIFVKAYYPHRDSILSDIYELNYIGAENDKKNMRHDISNLLFDFKIAVSEAKTKLNN